MLRPGPPVRVPALLRGPPPGRRGVSGAGAGTASRGQGQRRGPGEEGAGEDGPASRSRAWAELLRLPALLTVPGDALAGAAAAGARPTRGTILAVGASVSLYAAGMALNDWADRDEDARDRPHRPLPSGRVQPAHALLAAGALTGTGVALASRAGRTTGTLATALAATVWAYDLRLKHTAAGPAAMGAARGLDLLMGAAASRPAGVHPVGAGARGDLGSVLTAAAALAVHTTAVTAVSRSETQGGSVAGPLTALATGAAIAAALLAPQARDPRRARGDGRGTLTVPVTAYATTALRPLFHAALNPSPPLTQRAVGAGIRALVPLQSALAARSGAPVTALATLALAPLARRFAKKVSVT
ncbi:SCO3242 family prenyltransferase [Streptomyces sp. NPDC102360]|uniref:SCO3242 family prenyltransferase n=1 Tax=Streptomyces sp. NPDC102360 TaxID=3366160 RepID=UPI00382726BF